MPKYKKQIKYENTITRDTDNKHIAQKTSIVSTKVLIRENISSNEHL